MTKVIIRKQYNDNGQKGFFQIFWMSASEKVTSNTNATWDQVIAVSNVAMRAGFKHTEEVKPLDGGQEIIDTWKEEK